PLPTAPTVDSTTNVLAKWNVVYDAYNEVVCLILGSMTPKLHRQFEKSSSYDMIKELKSINEKQAGVESLTKDFVGFVRNYNMHNMEKTISELHAMLIEYEKGLSKKAETPQVMMIKGDKIQKAKKKSLKAKGKGKANGKGNDKQVYILKPKNPKLFGKKHTAKDDTCHHCKELSCLSCNGIYEIDMHDLVPNVNSIYNVSTKRAKHNLDFTYLWHCRLAHISKKHIEKLQQEGILKSTDDESFNQCVSCLLGNMTRKSFPHHPERATDLLGIIHTNDYALKSATRILNMVPTKKVDKTSYELWIRLTNSNKGLKFIFIGYPRETMGYYFYFPPENKIVVTRYAEFFKKNLITQEVSGRA
nr:hypothetical protein [Tanacetum cinerariifolium]